MESKATRDLCREWHLRYGAEFYPIIGNFRNEPGWPDRILIWGGIVFVEFKTYEGKLTEKQLEVHTRIYNQGGSISVVRFWKDTSLIKIERILEDFETDWFNGVNDILKYKKELFCEF